MALPDQSRRFWRISAAGIFFQGGAAAVDSSTIIATLVHGLTGSPFAVGAATAILRYGWRFPQIFVAYLAQRRRRRMPFYMVGAFARVVCLSGVAAALAAANILLWYFAFGANMHDSAFIQRRGMRPLEWRVGRLKGYRLRFNLEGRPIGKAAPANIAPDADGEVWGVLYLITQAAMVRLDASEGVPGRRYRHLWAEVEDAEGERLPAMTYITEGKERDGNPSLRYITLLREGARAHGLPLHYIRFLESVKHAE